MTQAPILTASYPVPPPPLFHLLIPAFSVCAALAGEAVNNFLTLANPACLPLLSLCCVSTQLAEEVSPYVQMGFPEAAVRVALEKFGADEADKVWRPCHPPFCLASVVVW